MPGVVHLGRVQQGESWLSCRWYGRMGAPARGSRGHLRRPAGADGRRGDDISRLRMPSKRPVGRPPFPPSKRTALKRTSTASEGFLGERLVARAGGHLGTQLPGRRNFPSAGHFGIDQWRNVAGWRPCRRRPVRSRQRTAPCRRNARRTQKLSAYSGDFCWRSLMVSWSS